MIPTLKEVKTEYKEDGITVSPIWNGVDRPCSGGWGLKATHQKLAARLALAIERGVVCVNPVIKTDIYQQTYVSYDCTVRGRCLNADLKALGF